MDKQYTSAEDIENYLGINIADEFESQIDDWIIAMSDYVAIRTSREWLADVTATTRVFNGNGYSSIQVDDFIGIIKVEVGSDFLEDMEEVSEYVTHPFNTNSKNTIILKSDSFDSGIQNVRITAKWGYLSEVPEDIKHATTVLVGGIVLAQSNQDGEVESERIGNYTVKYATESQKSDFQTAQEIISNRTLIRV